MAIPASDDAPRHGPQSPRPPKPWRLWLRLWVTPEEGWKRMAAARPEPQAMASAIFYPMAAFAAVGAFANMIYMPEATVATCLKEATTVFIAFFAGLHLFLPLARLLMRRDCAKRLDTDFGRSYVTSLMASLALIYGIFEWVPFMEPVVAFAPAYTIYVQYKGLRLLRVPQDRTMSVFVLSVMLIIAVPIIIYQLFGLLLPLGVQPVPN